jgi:phosphoglycerol transferase MdoB-like AlkP superfamily enzyme
VNQLEQNGACDFVIAFRSNTLDYKKFYPMMPQQTCVAEYRQQAGLNKKGEKMLGDSLSPLRKNIVLITVESLSADFMTRYGNQNHITPNLDQLVSKSLVFDSLYACGNRTVRGLEALSLCIPPSAGESIIKRPENRMGSLSVGSVLKKLGYTVQFLYGGDSYFDNMRDYFSHNSYEVIDRASILQKDIHFENIWGVCDEDIFDKGLQVFDADSRKGKPFFAQIMTTSNHRPYTYPEGRIQYDGNPQCRDAAVKYTDYAIGRFLSQASKKSWFKNTVFIIIADHCASSAGKTSLPLDKYHIPCLVYSPDLEEVVHG